MIQTSASSFVFEQEGEHPLPVRLMADGAGLQRIPRGYLPVAAELDSTRHFRQREAAAFQTEVVPHAVRRIAVAAQALLLAQSVIPIGMDVPISICGRAPDIHYVFSARSIPSLLRRPTPVFQCSYAESLRPSAKDDLFCIIPFCQEHNEFGQYISLCFSSYTVYAPIILSASSPNACFLSPS